MQKKLIALAVAALASGAAFAQSNVTIYGNVDVGFSHRGDHQAKGVSGQNAIDSGISDDSYVGFKGVEDLGNGLKALFVLEAAFTADNGSSTGSLFEKQAFLGLTGNFGTAIAGRLVAPRYSLIAATDPFGDGTVGRFHNVFNDLQFAGVDIVDVDRVNNAVAYVSPSFSGFNVTAAYATNAVGTENLENSGDARVYTVLPRYTNGPLDIGVAYQQIKVRDTNIKTKQWTVAGSYDLKVVKLGAWYDTDKINALGFKSKAFGLGATVPFGKNAIQVSYNQSKFDGAGFDNDKAKQWALGYTYSLSKRTNFYAAYSDIKNDKKNGVYLRETTVSDANNDGQGYQNGLQFGLKHSF
ncbi:porin [Betaproteobacteria bacterium]|nr:porin [Betaproteobacteria bacterium]GHU41351.1 porin [Betaproteobacteria bacterium]